MSRYSFQTTGETRVTIDCPNEIIRGPAVENEVEKCMDYLASVLKPEDLHLVKPDTLLERVKYIWRAARESRRASQAREAILQDLRRDRTNLQTYVAQLEKQLRELAVERDGWKATAIENRTKLTEFQNREKDASADPLDY